MAKVRINRTRSRAYARDWAESNKVGPLSTLITNAARMGAPVLTGALRSSIRDDKKQTALEVRHRIGSRLNYAYLIHVGARPHLIKPRNPKGRLVFFWRKVGRVVSLRSVNHPGFKGVPYLQRPLVEFGTSAGFKVIIYPHIG